MGQNYRGQNEPGRGQDYPRAGYRSGGRERYETGNERRYSPDWDDRFHESSSQDDAGAGFEGDRSYTAGGYPEEFGYRHDSYAERDRGAGQRYSGYQQGRDQRGGSYFDQSHGGPGRSSDFSGRDSGSGGYGRSHTSYSQANRSEDFGRGRNPYYGGSSGSGYGSSRQYGAASSQLGGRNYESELRGEYGGSAGDEQRHAQPSYRGRGPKGYERSDERLREMICERLTDDPYIDASEVTVEVNNKVVKLTGTIEDRRMKYLLEDVIEECGGVRDIDNQLRVQSSQSSSASSQAHSQTTPGSSSLSQYGTSSNDGGLANRGSADKSISPSTKRN